MPRIALIGPGEDQPCGIADYVRRLAPALAARCGLLRIPFREALGSPALAGCDALLVHYERSLVPGPDFLRSLAERHPGRVFVVPHEVYREDPFAHPYAALRSAFPPLLWAKRLRYRWRHREYAREKALQRALYHAHRVIPASREGAEILREIAPAAATRVLEPVPVARWDLPRPPEGAADGGLFAGRPRLVFGIFGFLNPGLDYAAAFDLVEALGPDAALLLLGGDRPGAGTGLRAALETESRRRGLGERVRITGWLEEAALPGALAACGAFLCPMRFKSSSASLLQLFALGRPILVPDLPLTRWLRGEGAPLDLYAGAEGLAALGRDILEGRHRAPADAFRWDLAAVADAYLAAIAAHRP